VSAARWQVLIDNKATSRCVREVRRARAKPKFDIWPVVYIDLMSRS